MTSRGYYHHPDKWVAIGNSPDQETTAEWNRSKSARGTAAGRWSHAEWWSTARRWTHADWRLSHTDWLP